MKQLDIINSKFYTISSIQPMLRVWNFKGDKIVFSNGCFDLFHLGHVQYLAKAADLGTKFIIGLNSDASVKKIKGNGRPIQSEESRKFILAALHFVDAVILFDEETPYNLIKAINPHILVKGNDYKPEEIAGYDIVKNNGGEIHTIELVPDYSSSKIIDKIKTLDK